MRSARVCMPASLGYSRWHFLDVPGMMHAPSPHGSTCLILARKIWCLWNILQDGLRKLISWLAAAYYAVKP
eukprot:1186533-Amphidinium_carterae.1